MIDSHGRSINYLRLSITDRCNLRCQYCMPEDGVQQIQSEEILSYEDFLKIVTAATKLGIKKVRITGGEPLVRKGILDFLEQLAAVPGVEEIALTTNGVLLSRYAQKLKAIGIERLNISIDSLVPENFAKITRCGNLQNVLDGITAADEAGMKIKLNVVAMRGVNDQEIVDFAAMSQTKPWSIRFIEYMPTIRDKEWRQYLITGKEILEKIESRFQLRPISSGCYCGPAKPYQIAGAKGTVGIITPMSEHFCNTCNRIRVTSDGQVKSCLFSDLAYDLKPYLSADDSTIYEVLQDVILNKPPRHHMDSESTMPAPFTMAKVGG